MQETLKFPQPVLPIRRRKMKAFFNTKSIVGRIVIVSLLAGGLVFASAVAVNMFVPTPTEASNCCGSTELGGTKDKTSGQSNCCGGGKALPTTSSDDDCPCNAGGCDASSCSDCTPKKCPTDATCNDGNIDCGCDGQCNSYACNDDC